MMSHDTGALAAIQRQVMWNRLIAVVEEQAQIMIRTAFCTTVREAGDLSAGIFDLQGPHDGAGRHRHAGPRELDGGERRRISWQKFPAGDDAAGRSLHHQRPLARHRPSARPHRRHARVPSRHGSSACSPTPRTSSTSAASAWVRKDGRCSRKGSTSRSSNASTRGGRTRRSSTSSAPARGCRSSWRATSIRCAPATTPARSRLVADDGRVRAWTASIRSRTSFSTIRSRATLAEIAQLPAGHISARDRLRRLRRAGDAARRVDDRRRRDRCRFRRHLGPVRRGINVPAAYCRAYACFGMKVVVAPDDPEQLGQPGAVPRARSPRAAS